VQLTAVPQTSKNIALIGQPKGASQSSLGQRPRKQAPCGQALKGDQMPCRERFKAALSGLIPELNLSPGRCPGLV